MGRKKSSKGSVVKKRSKSAAAKGGKSTAAKKKVLLSIKNASYRYSDAKEGEYALRDANFEFKAGKVYAIRGRSGSGKTTLLSLISGLERCTEGEIVFNGKNLREINLDHYRSHDIGIVFQSYNLLPFMTASENIVLSMDASGGSGKGGSGVAGRSGGSGASRTAKRKLTAAEKKAKAVELMKSVGLKESYADRKVLRLSGGEQQRVAIARSLSYDPKMIVADEPTGNLDKQTEEEILEIFKDLAHKEGKCVIIVTHSGNVCEKVDEVFELRRGKASK